VSGVFISYRREDARPYARDLAGRLEERLGGDRVFMDLDIRPGERFRDRIEKAMAGSALVLAIIGPRWYGQREAGAPPRIVDEDDWVRLELRTALERTVPIMPVLVNGAELPIAAALPTDVRALLEYHAIEISEERYDYDAGRLLEAVEALLSPAPVPVAAAAPAAGIDPAHLLDEVRVLDRVVNWRAAGRARGLLEAGETVLGVAAVTYTAEPPTFTGEPPSGLLLATDRRLLSVPNRSRLSVRSVPYATLGVDDERADDLLSSFTLRVPDGDLPVAAWSGEGTARFLHVLKGKT
jgi:hypothetical protein